MRDIKGLVDLEKTQFETPIDQDDGWTFDFPRILKKIDRYYNGEFMGRRKDRDGFKKLFFNIVRRPVKTSQKSVDIDTKDIRIKADDGQSYLPSWLLEKELKQFMKDEKFGELLNVIVEKYPKYGEVVIKNVNGKPKDVPLQNLRYDPEVHIEDSPWVHELHSYTLDEFQNTASDLNWDAEAVKDIVDLYRTHDIMKVEVIERYGYYTREDLELEGDQEELVYGRMVVAGLEEEMENIEKKKRLPITILDKSELDKSPYRSLSWEEKDGRGLGIGVVEENFELQEFYNDVNNKERKALEWNTKKLFRTSDPNAPKNLFITKRTGDVIESRDFEELPIQERNLAQFNALYQRITSTADQNSFTFEVNTGESLPSGTPFRLGAVLSNAVNSYFDFKREKLGLFWQGIILDFVIPEFKRKKRKGHILNFSADSDELMKFDLMIANTMLQKEMEKFEKENKMLPTLEEVERERQRILEKLQQKDDRFANIPDKFYDDARYKLDVVITGEQVDTQTDLTTLTSLYQVLAQQGNPKAESVLNKILSLAGQNPVGLLGLGSSMRQVGGTAELNPATPSGQTQSVEIATP